MSAIIEVRVGGHGSVRAGVKEGDAPFACKSCLRGRLEAITVAMWELKAPPPGLPWGKVSG
jgi:hypothetical protein